MPPQLKNTVIMMMNSDSYSNDQRQFVLDKIDEFLKSEAYTSILGICLKQCGLSIGNLTKLLSIITTGLNLAPKLVKTLDKNGRKYLLFAVLFSFVSDECPQFFDQTINISEFILLFEGAYELINIVPANIAKVKTGLFC